MGAPPPDIPAIFCDICKLLGVQVDGAVMKGDFAHAATCWYSPPVGVSERGTGGAVRG